MIEKKLNPPQKKKKNGPPNDIKKKLMLALRYRIRR